MHNSNKPRALFRRPLGKIRAIAIILPRGRSALYLRELCDNT
ncbi:MAG: hypothetical protein ACM65L_20410 [Microcoleus sp.]